MMRDRILHGTWAVFAIAAITSICHSQTLAPQPRAAAADHLYQESLRPQLCFTARKNWLNDPNGLVFYQDEYHLFFQHNPHDVEWGNMTWGHAVSKDLVHWKQLEDAIEPDALGTIFSGSAVVDWHNTAGFQSGAEPALVAMYTAAGGTSSASQGAKFTQCLAYSNDRGRTWTKYADNPVLPHIVAENRDPKVIWHESTKRWIMVLYLDKNDFAIFSSPDLKTWERTDDLTLPNSIECPDLFELPVEGRAGMTKWVFWTANNVYLIGDFDGRMFTQLGEPQRFEHGANCFAAQTFSDIPATDGRRIQIAWMRGGQYPQMPFNQQMNFPTTLTLHNTGEGYRLHSQPIAELESLRQKPIFWQGELNDANNPLADLHDQTYEMLLKMVPKESQPVRLNIRGTSLIYDTSQGKLSLGESTADVPLVGGELHLQILIDRTSIQVFANGGAVTFTQCYLPQPGEPTYELTGTAANVELTAWPLKSIWAKREIAK